MDSRFHSDQGLRNEQNCGKSPSEGRRAEKVGRHAIDRGNKKGLPPVEVGRVVHPVLVAKRPKERYIVAREKVGYELLRILPARAVDALVARRLRKIDQQGD